MNALDYPRTFSNRHLYDTLKAWGWQEGKRQHDWVTFNWPENNRTIEVLLPSVRGRNKNDAVKVIVVIMFGSSSPEMLAKFWNEAPRHKHAVPDPLPVDEPQPAPKPKVVTGLQPGASAANPVATTLEEREAMAAKIVRKRGTSAWVLGLLIESKQPMSADQLTYEADGAYTRDAIVGAAGYLVTLGLVERVVQGVYRAVVDIQKHDARVRHDISDSHPARGHVPTPEPVVIAAPVAPVTPFAPRVVPTPAERPVPYPTPVPAPINLAPDPDPEDKLPGEEEFGAILDMLFPNGFKAKHLPAIDRWMTATKELVKNVLGNA